MNINEAVRDLTSMSCRTKSGVRKVLEKYTEGILQQCEEDFKGLITLEIANAHKEGSPTKRLTALFMKI